MFGKSPPAESFETVQTLHEDIGAMIVGALTALTGEEEGGNCPQQSKMELADFVQLQSKTLMSIMDEKVAAAEDRSHKLQQDFEQERQRVSNWFVIASENSVVPLTTVPTMMLMQLEENISGLQAKCRAAEINSTELQEEVARCKRELESRNACIDELMRYEL
jgi:actin-related protein